jgi:ribosomal protein L21E
MTRQQLSDSARDFAQKFYSWYVPIALNEHAGPASDLALKHRSSAFSPELLRALKEDSAAQANSPGEIVGLDFDPFLNSQDPEDRYEVGKVTRKGDSYWVEVYGVRSGKRMEPVAVLAELVRRNGHWTFVNFHYPGPHGTDLLSLLKRLREERQKSAH